MVARWSHGTRCCNPLPLRSRRLRFARTPVHARVQYRSNARRVPCLSLWLVAVVLEPRRDLSVARTFSLHRAHHRQGSLPFGVLDECRTMTFVSKWRTAAVDLPALTLVKRHVLNALREPLRSNSPMTPSIETIMRPAALLVSMCSDADTSATSCF